MSEQEQSFKKFDEYTEEEQAEIENKIIGMMERKIKTVISMKYYQKNKEEINKKRTETKYTCEYCNVTIRRDAKINHEKTKKHLIALSMYVKH
jgi:hypothetical protein